MKVNILKDDDGKSFLGSLKSSFIPFGEVNKLFYYSMFIIQIGIILSLWHHYGNVNTPKPAGIAKEFIKYMYSVDFWSCFLSTFFLTAKAMIYSILISCIFAYAWTLSSFKILIGIVNKLRFISLSGVIFTAIMILKDGASVKLYLLMLGVIPYFTLSIISAIAKIEPKEFNLCQTLGFNRWQTLWELVIYGRLDITLDTIRINFAMIWMMITNIEIISMTGKGIGIRLHDLDHLNRVNQIFAIQLFIIIFGSLFDFVTLSMRYKLFRHTKLNELKK